MRQFCYILLQHAIQKLTAGAFHGRLAPNFKGTARGMDDLLTTRQLQDLLQVDRITIYRMLNDGRLRGFKVGGQWRFSRQEIEAWLQKQRADLGAVEEPPPTRNVEPSTQVLPLSCVQAIQDVCAEALDIGSITINPDGTPFTDMSNSCDFCNLILSSEEGQRRCAADWKAVGNGRVQSCHAGLLYISAPIKVGGHTVAITAGCQFITQPLVEEQRAWASNLSALAAELGLSEDELWAAVDSVRQVPEGYLVRFSRLLGRVVDTFSEIGRERLGLLSRLQHIAEMSKIK
jgi:excisionase family DNA binding protein